MRHFYLLNKKGSAFYFDYRTSTLFSNPAGLGINKENTYLKFDFDYLEIKEDNPISEISGTLIFLKGYKGYHEFLNYLKDSKDLNFYYSAETKKYCHVIIKKLSKTELVYGVLQCELVMDRLSLWKNNVALEIDLKINTNSKVYPYTFPFIYSVTYEGKIKVKNNGSIKAPLLIEIDGAVDEPEICILKNDEILSKLKLYVKSDDCKIIVDSTVTNQNMKMIVKETEEDIYQYQDFTCDNFLFIDPGDFEIEFKPGVSFNTKCKITFIEGYMGN